MASTATSKQKGSFILSAVIFIAVILIIYQVVKNRQPKDLLKPKIQDTLPDLGTANNMVPGNATDTEDDEPSTPKFDSNKVLKRGSKGEEVRYLQQALNRVRILKKLKPIGVDGSFGPETEASVQSFMGSKSTTYAKVKAAVIGTFKNAGQPNPYDNESSTAGTTGLFGNPWWGL